MTSVSAPSVISSRTTTAQFSIVDLAAPAFVAIYVVLFFGPLALVFQPPGAVASVLFPVAGVVILALCPLDRVARIPISWAMASLVCWLMMSWFWTETEFSTEFQLRSQLPPLVILALVVGIMRPEVVVRTLVGTVVAVAVWTLGTSILLPMSRAAVLELGAAGNTEAQQGLRGTFGHKNQMGIFMVFALCLVVAFVRSRARPHLVVLCVGLIIGTRSATAGSGLFAVMFVGFWVAAISQQRTARERTLLGLISIMSAATAILLVVGVLPAILDIYQKDLTFSGRTYIWAETLESAAERPLHGYGFGGLWYDARSPTTADLWSRIGFPATHAHNGPIELTLQSGLVGLAFYLSLIVGVIALSLFCFGDSRRVPYGQWGVLTIVALLLMSVSEPLFTGAQTGLVAIMWTVLARTKNEALRAGAWRRRQQKIASTG
ncbi:MAG: O-antigen ligase family protein [Actinomycetota bacterium]|nr:O-antigen ligase family protein [Actinomycetota bacterium]